MTPRARGRHTIIPTRSSLASSQGAGRSYGIYVPHGQQSQKSKHSFKKTVSELLGVGCLEETGRMILLCCGELRAEHLAVLSVNGESPWGSQAACRWESERGHSAWRGQLTGRETRGAGTAPGQQPWRLASPRADLSEVCPAVFSAPDWGSITNHLRVTQDLYFLS